MAKVLALLGMSIQKEEQTRRQVFFVAGDKGYVVFEQLLHHGVRDIDLRIVKQQDTNILYGYGATKARLVGLTYHELLVLNVQSGGVAEIQGTFYHFFIGCNYSRSLFYVDLGKRN